MDASPIGATNGGGRYLLTVWTPAIPPAGAPHGDDADTGVAIVAAVMLAGVEVMMAAPPTSGGILYLPPGDATLAARALRAVEAATSLPALLARFKQRDADDLTRGSPRPAAAAMADAVAAYRSSFVGALGRVQLVHVPTARALASALARLHCSAASPPAWIGVAGIDILLPGLVSHHADDSGGGGGGGGGSGDVAATLRLVALLAHTGAWMAAGATRGEVHVGFAHGGALHGSVTRDGATLTLPPTPLLAALRRAGATVCLIPPS